ncbi:MAG: hypothetical protein IPN36_12610 [Bacteroidetes bacterium]|nr:hypothetical protein [Bacteroidota bacterium]
MMSTILVKGDAGRQFIAPLLFIDLGENAFKHGIDKRFRDGFVHIDFIIEGNTLHFSIENSIGNNEQNDSLKQDAGIGLVNVKKRLSILYPLRHELDITKNEEIYAVKLKIDLS